MTPTLADHEMRQQLPRTLTEQAPFLYQVGALFSRARMVPQDSEQYHRAGAADTWPRADLEQQVTLRSPHVR
ncbi:hypothetical protein CMUS01_15045 [Colletotrichum musicola]|uniref:Uncharacterized protein n=1 Tax=Colletotrichum musicola TaxID=2175873 RepID=A0A8H6IZ79_9PEZI|nr:hypothetical protein CMUS01_15045 [Colletotrichum musicola]